MEDRLNINSVNLHYRFFAEESEVDVQSGITQGQDHSCLVVMEKPNRK